MQLTRPSNRSGRNLTALAVAVLLAAAKPVFASAADQPAGIAEPLAPVGSGSIPAGARVRFHLVEPLSSDRTKTGQPFSFVLLDPIDVDGRVLVTPGSIGAGTVVLSGHNGTSGHEGDLTLRLDSITARDGRRVTFVNQRIGINGRNKKAGSGILGFVPFVGIGALLIRGSEIHLDTTTPIRTVLLHPADITAATAVPTASPS